MGGHSPVVVIWRYSPDSHARQDGRRRRDGERGMRKCDDYTTGKECQACGEDEAARK